MSEIDEITSGIAKAIELEQQARDFYRRKGAKADNKIMKKSFEFLAKQEQEHFDQLSKLRENMKAKGDWPEDVPSAMQATPRIEEFIKGEKEHFGKMNSNEEIVILLWAMRAERRAENLYRELAEKSSRGKARKLFTDLANFELGHYKFLDSIVETLTDVSDYLES